MSTVRELTPTIGKSKSVGRPVRPLAQSMEDFFENFLGRPLMEPLGLRRAVFGVCAAREFRLPRVDMIDFDDHLLLRAELPGIKTDDIELSIADDSVTIAVVRDITGRKQAEEAVLYHATHDILTELPNRALFDDRLSVALRHAARAGEMLARFFPL